MMERRLLIAAELLKPDDSVLIVTIDEKEYLRLGLLLEQLLPEAQIEMITTVISAKGVARFGQFSRVEEFIFFARIGKSTVQLGEQNMLDESRSATAYSASIWVRRRARSGWEAAAGSSGRFACESFRMQAGCDCR